MKDLQSFIRSQVLNPTWQEYVAYRKHWKHEEFGLDWFVEQDFFNVVWQHHSSWQ